MVRGRNYEKITRLPDFLQEFMSGRVIFLSLGSPFAGGPPVRNERAQLTIGEESALKGFVLTAREYRYG